MGFPDILGIINNVANNVASSVGNEISGILNRVNGDVSNYVVKPLTDDINNALDGISHSLNIVESKIQSNIVSMLADVGAGIQNTENSINQGFERSLGDIGTILAKVGKDITGGFSAALDEVSNGFDLMQKGIITSFGVVVSGIEKGFHDVGLFIVSGIKEIMLPIEAFLKTIPEDIITVATKIGSTIDEGINIYKKDLTDSINKTARAEKFLAGANPLLLLAEVETVAEGEIGKWLWDNMGNIIGFDIKDIDPNNLARLIGATALEGALGVLLEATPSAGYIIGNALPPIMQTALAGAYRNLSQAGNSATPNELLGVGELIMGKYKGYITDDRFYGDMAKQAISKEVADKMFSISDELLGAGDLITLYRRGILKSKDELYKRAAQIRVSRFQVDSFLSIYDKLIGVGDSIEMWRRDVKPEGWQGFFDDVRASGVTDNRLTALKDASYKLASVTEYQDFIRRGVFNEPLAEKYKYDYELDEDYYKLAKANGYDRKTAKALYRKYWEVPPFFITEGLFKSGKLKEEDFRDMLTLEGYTPYWIDRLVDNLKPTLTPGDVKNLYKFQLITYEQIPEHLVDIGLPKALAIQYQQLWKASVALASPLDQTATQITAQKIKGETEGLIKSAYEDKIITKREAVASLSKIGYDTEAAGLIIDIADYKEKNNNIRIIAETAGIELRSKSINITDAVTRIQDAGATAMQLDKYTADFDRIASVKDKIPTKAEFEHWYKKGIINPKQLAAGYNLLGYSNTWVPYFLAENGVSGKVIKTLYPTRNITL